MPASSTQLQQDIDRVLKRVNDSVHEFSNKVEAKSRDLHGQDELHKLSNALQQDHSELQSLLNKNGVRKAQKEKLQAARSSVDGALESIRALGEKLMDNEANADAGSSPRNSDGGRSTEVTSDILQGDPGERAAANKDAKVQWDQLVRDASNDCEMLEEFICKICQVHVVGCEPKLARCSHLFCGDCIATWFAVQPRSQSWAQRAQAAGLVPCPVCKEPLHEERDLYPVCPGQSESALLWRLLSGVKIVCANNPKCRADGRCTWVGGYGSYQKHIQNCANVELDSGSLPVGAGVETKNTPKDKSAPALVKDADPQDHQPNEKHGNLNAKIVKDVRAAQPPPEASAVCAVRCFVANGPSELGVQLGEKIQVLTQHESGWTYGRKVLQAVEGKANEESIGWFPNWAIA